MADNTTLNTGSGGDVIATDDIGGIKHQRVKVEFGGDGSATEVSTTDGLPVRPYHPSTTAGISRVATSTTSASLLASNANRKASFQGAVKIINDASSDLYVKYGATASSTSYSVLVPAKSYWEQPADGYTGAIDGILASGSGNAQITEQT